MSRTLAAYRSQVFISPRATVRNVITLGSNTSWTFTAPPSTVLTSCAEGGVLGALAGTVGSLQAVEVLKEVMQIGETLAGSLLIYDALSADVRKIKLPRDVDCPLCGDTPSITDLSAYAA